MFTRVFVRQMTRPGLNLIHLGESVRDKVARLAETVPHRQVPAYYNEVRGTRFVSLAGPGDEPPAAPRPASRPKPLSEPLPAPRPPAIATRPDPPPTEEVLPAPAPPARFGSYSHPVRLDPYGNNCLALRNLPSGQAGSRLMKLGPDTLFTVIGRQGPWLNVGLRTSQPGWVHGDYVGCCRRAPLDP